MRYEKRENVVVGGTPIAEFENFKNRPVKKLSGVYNGNSVDSVLNPIGCSLLHEPIRPSVKVRPGLIGDADII